MGRFCEVISCYSNTVRNSNKSFFKFPTNNIETCWSWIRFCRSLDLEKMFTEHGSAALRRKVLCSDHFSIQSLRDPVRRDRGLKIGAIPSLIVDATLGFKCQCIYPTDQQLDREGFEHYCNVEYLDPDHNDEEEQPPPMEPPDSPRVVEPTEELICSVSSWNPEHIDLGSVLLAQVFEMDNHILITENNSTPQADESSTILSLRALLKTEREKNLRYKEEVKQLKEKLRASERKCHRRHFIIKSQRRKIRNLSDSIKQIRNKSRLDKNVLDKLKQNPAIFNSLKNCMKKPKARRYNAELRKFALSSYLCGPRVYRMMQRSEVICLPVKRTIKRWTKDVRIGPGLNNGILEQVKVKVKGFSEQDRMVILAIDGMKLKPTLNYMAKSDEFYGFPDDGSDKKIERNNPRHLATEAVTVMVKGIFNNFKQAIGYFLAHNSLGSEQQMKIIENTIRAVREVGLEPIVLVMDQFATNQKMIREAGVTKKKPYFTVDSRKVYVMWDSPHLIKSARNMLKKHNAVFEDEIASFEDIVNLYTIDSVANPRLAPRLTEKHIKLPPFSPMNVSLATRTLSQSVASALNYYSNSGELEERARETVNFIVTHDHLFDTFNSRQENCSEKSFKSALKERSCHWEFLENTKASLKKLYFTTKTCFNICKASEESRSLTARQRVPNYVRGFIHNINTLKMLWNELMQRFDCKFLCTNNICQDCLENLFSEIRRRCGSNDTPDCLQFGAAFKYACIETAGYPQEGSNCEKDDSVPLLSTTDPPTDEESRKSGEEKLCRRVCHSYKYTPLDVSTPLEIPVKELNALMYVAGAATRKLYHEKCIKNLKTEHNVKLPDDDAYNFCKIKQAVHARSFVLPSSQLYRIAIISHAAFKQKITTYLYQNHRNVKTRLKKHISYRLFETTVCQRCFDLLIDKIFNTLIQGFLKQLKSIPTKGRNRAYKRKGKARRMCLPLKTVSE